MLRLQYLTIFCLLRLTNALVRNEGASPSSVLLKLIDNARSRHNAIPLIGVHDALSAKIIANAETDKDVAIFVSGFGVSASRLGQPDAGILTRSDMEDATRNVVQATPSSIPVIMDGDTGYGGAANIRQTIRRAAAAGVAAVSIEDQIFPKRCTYVAGSGINVVDRQEAINRINSVLAAQKESVEQDGNSILVIARTDCRMGTDFEEVRSRCMAFEEAGADIVYAENLQSIQEYIELRGIVKSPMILAQVQTKIDDSILSIDNVGDLGYELALYGVTALQASIAAMTAEVSGLLQSRGTVTTTDLASLDAIKKLVGFSDLDEFEEKYPSS